jgi:Tol biopolymer transport system component
MGITKAGSYYYRDFGGRAGVEEVFVAEFTAGGGARVLESFVGVDPAWSPDGKALAFKRHSTRSQGRSNVVVRFVETGEEKTSSRDAWGFTPYWLHDSTRFLTLAEPDHEGGVPWWHIVDLTKNTFSRAIPNGSSRASGHYRAVVAAVSSDDKALYTAAGEPDNFKGWDRIVAVDFGTGQEREILRFSGTPELPGGGGVGIALSPDGRSLAVATTNPKTAEARLFRVDVDGGNYRELHGPYQANTTFGKLVWTKDGHIVFARSVGGRNSNRKGEIMRIGSAGGRPESTGLTIDNLRTFDLSPDGSRIAYATTAQTLASAPVFYAIDNLPALLKGAQ